MCACVHEKETESVSHTDHCVLWSLGGLCNRFRELSSGPQCAGFTTQSIAHVEVTAHPRMKEHTEARRHKYDIQILKTDQVLFSYKCAAKTRSSAPPA